MTSISKQFALKSERNEKIKQSRDLLDRAQVEHRSLSRREQAAFDSLEKDLERLTGEIRRAGAEFDPRAAMGDTHRAGGEDTVVLAPEQRVADWVSETRSDRPGPAYSSEINPHDVSIGKLVRGMATGEWRGAETEHRALVEGTDSAGGYLTPEPLAARFIDRVRNATRVMQAGAQTVPMTSDKLAIARLTGGASVSWKTEGNAITASDMTFDRVNFQAQTLPILVKLSQELFDDMTPEASAGIENEIAQALSLELDRAALRGSGSAPEPRGIRNQSGITVQSLGASGATPTWDSVIDGVSNVRALNLEPNALIWSPRTAQTLGKVKASTGEYLTPPSAIEGVTRLVSGQVPNNLTVGGNGDCSEIYIADWSQLLIGIRTDLRFRIRVLDQRYADNLQIGLLCFLRADVQLAHPEAFNVITGVRP